MPIDRPRLTRGACGSRISVVQDHRVTLRLVAARYDISTAFISSRLLQGVPRASSFLRNADQLQSRFDDIRGHLGCIFTPFLTQPSAETFPSFSAMTRLLDVLMQDQVRPMKARGCEFIKRRAN